MAVVDGLSKERMLEIEAQSVTGGTVDEDSLVLTRHDGSSFVAGNVRGPRGDKGDAGNAVDLSRPWSRLTTYNVNDVVGYAGRMWKAKISNLDKPPYFHTNTWTAITGYDESTWVERDPNFVGTNVDEAIEIYWGGGTRTKALTKVAGEFESFQALKMTFGTNSNSWLYSQEENVVRGGEKIRIRVRAKLLSAAPGTLLRGLITQNTPENTPSPFVTGYVSTEDPGGPKQLTTEWATYSFVITTLANKPRARSLVLVEAWSNPANVVIDYIRVDRLPDEVAPVTKLYVDSAVAPLAAKSYVDSADTALSNRLTTVEGLVPTAQVTRYFPLALSNFTTAGMVTVSYFPNGKRQSIINYQITRTTSNYGVLSSTSWIFLGIITNAAARYTGTLGFYSLGWINALEGALPCSISYDNSTGNVYVKAIPGTPTTMNIGHFIQFSLVVNET